MEELYWKMVSPKRRCFFCGSIRPELTCVRNRGDLSEGWYDPSTLQKAQSSYIAGDDDNHKPQSPAKPLAAKKQSQDLPSQEPLSGNSDSDDSVGPALPGQESRSRSKRMGPNIPNMEDLEFKRGTYAGL